MVIEDQGEGASLASLVYAELKRRLNAGLLRPGDFLDQAALGEELGMSRAPLRDALIRLDLEGFVSVFPRRGVMVRPLDLPAIRDLYEIIGALEGAAAAGAAELFGPAEASRMETLIADMESALAEDDFDRYYASNLAFHETYLELSPNLELKRQVRLMKERLYDFPRRSSFVKAWELSSMEEHRSLARLLAARDGAAAASYIREVHWSFKVQEPFIHAYYFGAEGRARTRASRRAEPVPAGCP